jgi:transporter family protein
MGPASSVAPVDKLSVVLVILGAWLFLGEHLTPLKIVRESLVTLAAVILACVEITERAKQASMMR